MHCAEVGDLGRSPELVGLDVEEPCEDRRHRVVDPDIDRSELRLDLLGRRVDLREVRNVRGHDARRAAESLDLPGDRREGRLAAREQPEPGAAPRERVGDGTTDAGRRSR